MTDDRPTRRRFLRTSGLLGSLALAGCNRALEQAGQVTPPDIESETTVESIGRRNVVTTFPAGNMPEYWDIIGGPGSDLELTPNQSFAGSYSLQGRLDSVDYQVLGITSAEPRAPLRDGDEFFAWVYAPTSSPTVRFGLRSAFDGADGAVVTGAPFLHYSDGTAVGHTRSEGISTTETTVGTDFGPGQWIRLGFTVYPSANEVTFSVADDYGNRERTDRLAIGAGFTGEYVIQAYGEQTAQSPFYLDRITAGPYRKGQAERPAPSDDEREAGSDDTASLTAEGVPRVTLNWAYYVEDVLSEDTALSLSVATPDDAPQRALALDAVSVCSDYDPPAYYEEYQTAAGARRRLAVGPGETVALYDSGSTTEATVRSRTSLDGYPNEWVVLETDLKVYALSRAGGLVAGGYIDKNTYLDPVDTLLEQIETGTRPEGGGMASHPLAVLRAFEGRYGHTPLDPSAHTAASVPTTALTAERAKDLVREWYPDDSYAELEAETVGVGGYPVDAYEAYEVWTHEPATTFDCRVVSWVSQDFADRFAERMLQGTTWTFDPDFYGDPDAEHANLGPYDEEVSRIQPPNCGLVTEDGAQKLRKVATTFNDNVPVTHDVYSGTLAIVRV